MENDAILAMKLVTGTPRTIPADTPMKTLATALGAPAFPADPQHRQVLGVDPPGDAGEEGSHREGHGNVNRVKEGGNGPGYQHDCKTVGKC